MNINERLKRIKILESQTGKYFHSDVEWICVTIKQLQEEKEKKHFDILALEAEGNGMAKRIEELEKENAHYLELAQENADSAISSGQKLEIANHKIAELEKENERLKTAFKLKEITNNEKRNRLSKITAAHEAFLTEFNHEYGWEKRNAEADKRSQWHKGALRGFEHSKEIYYKHFSDIHLAEAIRLATLKAGMEE